MIVNLLHSPAAAALRRLAAELARGLALAWFVLLVLELVRPTFASPYLNLNWLLGWVALLWLAGARPAPAPAPQYVSALASAILVGAATLVLAAGVPYRVGFASLAAVATFGLWLMASMKNGPRGSTPPS